MAPPKKKIAKKPLARKAAGKVKTKSAKPGAGRAAKKKPAAKKSPKPRKVKAESAGAPPGAVI